MIAVFDPAAGITVWGSLQCPYYVHKALMKLCGLPEEKVRVVQMETGGAFGGKEEYPSMIAAHAAVLAMKSGRPVKLIYDRLEDMAATTKHHPSRTRHRTALDKDGKLLGGEIEFRAGRRGLLDAHPGGALAWHDPRGRRVPLAKHPRARRRPTRRMPRPTAQFRGFGSAQSLFALERHMDRIVQVVGLGPEELRRRNFLRPGQTTATEQVIREPIESFATARQSAGSRMLPRQKTRVRREQQKKSH